MTTRSGNYVEPRNFDAVLDRLIERAELPRHTSDGLRHNAAALMVRDSADVGSLCPHAAAVLATRSPSLRSRLVSFLHSQLPLSRCARSTEDTTQPLLPLA